MLIHSGELEIRRAEIVDQAKRELQAECAGQLPGARAKLENLLERRDCERNGDE
jgi:hypothetical protein